jgi:hypothetical protein
MGCGSQIFGSTIQAITILVINKFCRFSHDCLVQIQLGARLVEGEGVASIPPRIKIPRTPWAKAFVDHLFELVIDDRESTV